MLLLILYVYACYRWTKRIARTAELQNSKLAFVRTVCLRMSWRIALLGFALIFIVGITAVLQASPGQDPEATGSRGAEMGLTFAIIGIPLSLIIAVIVAVKTFDRRSGFFILLNGKMQGAFSKAEIRRMRLQKELPENASYWREGLSNFRLITELEPQSSHDPGAAADVPRALDEPTGSLASKPPVHHNLGPITASEPQSAVEKELRSLARLKLDGIISEEEFIMKKRALLGI